MTACPHTGNPDKCDCWRFEAKAEKARQAISLAVMEEQAKLIILLDSMTEDELAALCEAAQTVDTEALWFLDAMEKNRVAAGGGATGEGTPDA